MSMPVDEEGLGPNEAGLDEDAAFDEEDSAEDLSRSDEEVAEHLRELVAFMAESLVDEPDQVRVSGEDDDGMLRLELTVASDDVGKVIGREGKTARAMRTLLATTGAKMRQRVNLQILE